MKKEYRYLLSILLFFLFSRQYAQCSQIDAGDDVVVSCTNNIASLTAELFPGINSSTNTYEVTQPTPCPLFPSSESTSTGITVDDFWSEVIDLPFTFYFFGEAYTQVIIGPNGVLSFDTNTEGQTAGEVCRWQFSDPLPSINLFKNTIFGAYHDLDVSVYNGGTIEYYISGEFPQRKFVISYNEVAHHQCENLRTTQRIVLYESSNVIDVQIDRKDTCSQWNNGNALIGIQNESGDLAYVPEGRNTGAWTVPASEPELWRFVPNYAPIDLNIEFRWYNNTTGELVGNEQEIQVNPTVDTEYRLEVEFDDPDNTTHYFLTDTVTVYFDDNLGQPDLGGNMTLCYGAEITLDGTANNAVNYQWQKNGVDIPGATNSTLSIIVEESATYTVIVDAGVCEKSDDVFIEAVPAPQIELNADFHECEGTVRTLTPLISNLTGEETFQWQKDGVDIPGATGITLDISESGTYTLNITTTTGCVASKSVEVFYDEYPDLDLGEDLVVCPNKTARISSNIKDAEIYTWEVNGQVIPLDSETLMLETSGDYEVVLTITRGVCTVTDSLHVKILEPLSITPTPVLYGELAIEAQGGLPPYQYSIDGINYIKDAYFTNLPDGDYPIYVLDANGCQYEFEPVHVTGLDVPKYMTPNGDGYNDLWRVGNAENTPEAILNIYNRYGKLVKQMHTATTEFWDGTYNGKPLPATDYWYVLTLPNGKAYKGHFALKR